MSPQEHGADRDRPVRRSRRRFLRAIAAGVGVAGCNGQPDPSSPSDEPRGTEAPTRVRPPTESDVRSRTDRSSPSRTGTSGASPAPSGPWPTARADSANTGAVDAAGPRGEPSVRWRGDVQLRTRVRATTGPDGPVAARADGTLLAYDDAGERRWRRRFDAGIQAAPVVAPDGTVVAGTTDGTVAAFDPDGTRRWTRETAEGLFAPHVNDATPFRIADGTVVVAHPDGALIAFALADGTRRWRVDAPPEIHRPAVRGDRIFLTAGRSRFTDGSVVQARSLVDGAELWEDHAEGPLRIAPGVGDGVVYTGNIGGLLRALDAEDGSERWRVRVDDDPWISTVPTPFADRVWIGTLSDGVYGVTEAGVRAHAAVDRPTTPALGDDSLYVGSGVGRSGDEPGGTVIALDGDGTEQWRSTTRGSPESQVRYRDGHVVYGTDVGVTGRLAAADGDRAWRAIDRPDRLPTPVVGSATVYCGGRANNVDGYRATDGASHLWTARFDGVASPAPAVAGETVLAGSEDGEVAGIPPPEHAAEPADRLTVTETPDPDATPTPHFDAPVPDPRWQVALDGPVRGIGYGSDRAYVAAGSAIAALTADGDREWERDLGSAVRGSPAVADGTVYATTEAGSVAALATADGTERWRRPVGDAVTTPAVARSGASSVVVGTDEGVAALAADDGTERWRATTPRVRGAPAVAGDLVVAGDERGVLRGLSLADGDERWRVETDGAIHGAPAVADRTAYVGSRDGHLYAVSIEDGSVAWRLELRDWVDGSPAVAFGAVFVVDQSGTLSAVVGDR